MKICTKADLVDTSMKFKKWNREFDIKAPIWEEHEYIWALTVEKLWRPVGWWNLIFNTLCEVILASMWSHSVFINNPTVDDLTGLLGFEEF